MHKPTDEKRMVVILDEADYAGWLACSVAEAPSYWRQWKGSLDAFPAPLPPRTRTRSSKPKPPPSPEVGDLF